MFEPPCTYKVTLRRVYESIVAVGKRHTLHISACVSARAQARGFVRERECAFAALLMKYAMRMLLVIFLSVASLAPPYFLTLSEKGHDFRKKNY
jgi:hypothetical protein